MYAKFTEKTKRIRFKIKQFLGIDEKIFIIGRNKTGTTSIEKCLKELGYLIGNQKTAELFIDDYGAENFDNILKFCDSAEVFQDVPFSLPNTYKYLYRKYPNAKYILLERDSSEEWYQSLFRFHRKIISNGEPVSAQALKDFDYRRKGFLWQLEQIVFGVNESNIYDKEIYIENYERYNREVKDFFDTKGNFLLVKLSDKNVDEKLAEFINKRKEDVKIPHLNQSR
ncbi:MAG: hypothetical protein ACJAS1_005228 [Oleiphilaceae bacterium]|jgi:hypothetical protein